MAALAAVGFLDVNGVGTLPPPEALENTTLDVAAGGMSKDDLTRCMREQVDER